jgi:hypothetical protein
MSPCASASAARAAVTVEASVWAPRSASGTKKHPQGVKRAVTARFDVPEAYDPPLVDRVTVLFPKGSIMGKGSGKAMADDVPTYPKVTIVNGGARRVYFYTVMTNPARVQAPIVGKITKLSGQYSYKLQAQIPKSLQIVAGVPIVLHELTLSGGKGDWLATTSCPADKRWRYHAEGLFTTGETIMYDDSVPCR